MADNQSTRRNILKGSAAVAVGSALAGGAAASTAQAGTSGTAHHTGSSNEPGHTLILAGTGAAVSNYSPSITDTPHQVSIHSETTFVPGIGDSPALLKDTLNGSFTVSCTSVPTEFNLQGKLTWSDGTTSTYNIDTLTETRLSGHCVTHLSGTIKGGSAHHAGKRIDWLGMRVAPDLTACFTGSGISSASGNTFIQITGG